MGLAFFFEYLDNTIKVPEDVKESLKIPYLGPVPEFDSEQLVDPKSSLDPKLITLHSPKSTASEFYRGIRTSVLLSSADFDPQVLLVSSAGPQEGKTLTASNLAITMAQSGSRILILDCDMRRPMTQKYFRLPKDCGMSNILAGNGKAEKDLIQTNIPNLDIIPSGVIPPNPSEMLGSSRMAALLKTLRKRYARIIIDSPPVTAVTDAVVISKFVDGVILVIRAGHTPREVIQNGITQFQAVGAKILGAVLNGVDMGRGSYYYYQHHYYYSEDGEKRKKRNLEKIKDRYRDIGGVTK